MRILSLFLLLSLNLMLANSSQAARPSASFPQKVEWIEEDLKMASQGKHATQIDHHGKKTAKAILIMHGLYESPAYMQGFAQHFYQKGYNVLRLRLPGHFGKNLFEMHQTKASQWLKRAEEAFDAAKSLGDEVEILGYSTGGTLAINLALKRPDEVHALYLISPALALRNHILLPSLALGWLNVDSTRFCQSYQSRNLICRALLISDQQKQMVKEGLISAPFAGLQVQVLINQMLNDYAPTNRGATDSTENYYQRVERVFQKLSVPLVMINTASDTVINAEFNDDLARNYPKTKGLLLFSRKQKITHLMMNKSPLDAFRKSPETLNPSFEQILETIDRAN